MERQVDTENYGGANAQEQKPTVGTIKQDKYQQQQQQNSHRNITFKLENQRHKGNLERSQREKHTK